MEPTEREVVLDEAPSHLLKDCAAVFVAHGMGQQIPFQTLDEVVFGLRQEDRRQRERLYKQQKLATPDAPQPTTSTIQHGDERLQRVEMSVCDDAGQEREVHLYEGYWAPLVEGKVTLRDVIGFLLRAGLNGIQNGARPFKRWVFGQYREFGTTGRTVQYLVAALIVVFSLIILNTTLIATAAARGPLKERAGWLSDALFADLTTTFEFVLTGLLVFVFTLLIGMGMQRLGKSGSHRWVPLLGWMGFWTALLAIMAAGFIVPILVGRHVWWARSGVERSESEPVYWETGFGESFVERFTTGVEAFLWVIVVLIISVGAFRLMRSLLPGTRKAEDHEEDPRGAGLSLILRSISGVLLLGIFWLTSGGILDWLKPREALHAVWRGISWPLLALASWRIRELLVQYLGDVAVYISPHVLDRFNELRSEIRNCVNRQVEAIYAYRENQEHLYQRIFVVGHSLGSVVVYDALNRLIVQDEIAKAGFRGHQPPADLNTLGRTKLLLTFGSPLDKTAFLFALQGRSTSETREALAAEVQPLIRDAGFRTFPWINIWSPQDIISGSLEFYDPPASEPHSSFAVQNRVDEDATTVIASHVEYWRNPKIFCELFQRMIDRSEIGGQPS